MPRQYRYSISIFFALCAGLLFAYPVAAVSPMSETVPYDGSDSDTAWVCNIAGVRESSVRVDIGVGQEREYWAEVNEHGQVVKVSASRIIVQDDDTEDVNNRGRYCDDEAKVPGTQAAIFDEGHLIADSLGGVSNAYNIVPQDRFVNRSGEQSIMENEIRSAGGATNFEMIITYPSTNTQVPSEFDVRYTLKGTQHSTHRHYVNGDDEWKNRRTDEAWDQGEDQDSDGEVKDNIVELMKIMTWAAIGFVVCYGVTAVCIWWARRGKD